MSQELEKDLASQQDSARSPAEVSFQCVEANDAIGYLRLLRTNRCAPEIVRSHAFTLFSALSLFAVQGPCVRLKSWLWNAFCLAWELALRQSTGTKPRRSGGAARPAQEKSGQSVPTDSALMASYSVELPGAPELRYYVASCHVYSVILQTA